MSLRAMFSSISGLQSDSTWLDVIGNNIANTNTVAYKGSRVEFADQFSQSLSNGTSDNPAAGLGGVNPIQVGRGTRVASIQTLFAHGSTMTTGIATDISIQGDGFFVTKQGNQSYLTRAGNLSFDSAGFLVDQNGGRVQGFNATVSYTQNAINTVSNVPGQPLVITQAQLGLNNTNISSLSDIQIPRDMTIPPKATTEVTFKGNLDSFQQPNVLDLFPGLLGGPPFRPSLPIGLAIAANSPPINNAIDTARMTINFNPSGGFALQQVSNLGGFTPGLFTPPAPLENGFINLGFVQAFAGSYVWDNQPPVQPAAQVQEPVYDSLGNPRQITVQFYQVNDLGAAGINNPAGPNQVCYAWYAFDTTGGKPVSTANLLGGTGIGEGDPFYDRNIPGYDFFGDFLWFNTDGSLASSGGVGGFQGPPGLASNFMSIPRVYLPPDNGFPPLPGVVSPIPTQGAEITAVSLKFGTFGLLGGGKVQPIGNRDGLYSDAEGSYQVQNGVSTYVPKHTAFAASQDGYSAGVLQGLNFDQQGILMGTFTNNQTVALGQVVLEQVQNPEGLSKVGSNDFALSSNSGPVRVGSAGVGNFGKVLGGSLESSNVDLSVELSNMIVAQRGFETNARMISVVNDELNVLRNLGQ